MTHSYVWHESFVYVTWLVYTGVVRQAQRDYWKYRHCKWGSLKRYVYCLFMIYIFDLSNMYIYYLYFFNLVFDIHNCYSFMIYLDYYLFRPLNIAIANKAKNIRITVNIQWMINIQINHGDKSYLYTCIYTCIYIYINL